jgi:condensin complex subunit 1
MNILRFIENLNYSHFIAFEELIKEFVASEEIDSTAIQVMFEIYTKKLDNVTNNDSRLALQLLVICSNANPSIARANIQIVEDICFDDSDNLKDSRVFSLTLEFMMNLYADRETEVYPRIEESNPRVQKIIKSFRGYFLNEDSNCFDEVCSKTFQFIYKMCNLPNIISENIIKDLYKELQTLSKTLPKENEDEEGVRMSQDLLSQGAPLTQNMMMDQMRISDIHLSRIIFMTGYVAMRELVYLDVDVFLNLKYRQDITELKNNKKKNNADVTSKRKSVMNCSVSAVKRKSVMPPNEEEEEEDIVGQSSEDVFVEQINVIFEKEMLFQKDSLFRKFSLLVFEILRHPKKYSSPILQRSSVLTLIHFMTVSSEFCETHMPFLFNVFTYTQDIEIKCNVIIGMSDLTFRFPNVIEPWSGHLYSTLHDENRELRLTAVRILSYLISHEMILVKVSFCYFWNNFINFQLTFQTFHRVKYPILQCVLLMSTMKFDNGPKCSSRRFHKNQTSSTMFFLTSSLVLAIQNCNLQKGNTKQSCHTLSD